MARLLGTVTSFATFLSGWDGRSWGNGFTVGADTTLQALLWYRRDTTAGRHPTTLQLWDVSGPTSIWDASASIPDDGAVGWQSVDAPAGITLQAGHHYRLEVGWSVANEAGLAYTDNFNPLPTPGSPLAWDTNPGWRVSGANGGTGSGTTHYGFPDTASGTSQVFGVDVSVADTGSTGGATTSDVANQFAAWLSAGGDNTHTSDLPWRTDANVTTIKSEAEGASGFDAIKAVADAVAAAVGGIPGTIASAVTTITGQLTTLTGNTAQTGIATIGAISHDLAGVFNHALDVLAGQVVTGTSSPNFTWTAGEPVSFTTSTLLAVAGDAYLLDIAAPAPQQALNVWNGVDVYFRAGWWAECIDGVGAERHYVDFRQTWLRDGVRRLGGCLVVLQPGTEATITPYTLGPA